PLEVDLSKTGSAVLGTLERYTRLVVGADRQVEHDLGSRLEASRGAAVADPGEPARPGPEVRDPEAVADLGVAGFDRVQAVVAHGLAPSFKGCRAFCHPGLPLIIDPTFS